MRLYLANNNNNTQNRTAQDEVGSERTPKPSPAPNKPGVQPPVKPKPPRPSKPPCPAGTPTAPHGTPTAPHGTPTAPHGTPPAPLALRRELEELRTQLEAHGRQRRLDVAHVTRTLQEGRRSLDSLRVEVAKLQSALQAP
uniref:Protein tonB2-like n=1 Tax=Petromyzon marinus TaxID=7757 RepID=A0AAJ7XBS7_PETMA|nr:protein tonB2-like [Petromyzon marinus]